jgi:hypothetical protein
MHLAGQRLGGFFGGDTNRLVGAYVHEGRCDLSPVAKLQSTLAEAATGDHSNGIGGATVDLDERNEALAVFSARIFYAEFSQAQHGESHAENLSGTEVTVSLLGLTDVFLEGFHKSSGQLSAFSLTSRATDVRRGKRWSFPSPSPADAIFGDLHQDAGIGEFGADGV